MQINKLKIFEEKLSNFFSAFQTLRKSKIQQTQQEYVNKLELLGNLALWFENLEKPLIKARRSGLLCDPWEIAGLERNELRNSQVLSWLLDPRGTHGLGGCVLESLLKEINRRTGKILDKVLPESHGKYCTVRTEISPNGDAGSRFDIEIDAEKFYLVIEVKIDASESGKQVERYGKISAVHARNRPWGIIFLTPSGRKCETAGDFLHKVTSLTWTNLSQIAARRIRHECKIYEGTKGSTQHMAEQLALRFFKKVRQF